MDPTNHENDARVLKQLASSRAQVTFLAESKGMDPKKHPAIQQVCQVLHDAAQTIINLTPVTNEAEQALNHLQLAKLLACNAIRTGPVDQIQQSERTADPANVEQPTAKGKK